MPAKIEVKAASDRVDGIAVNSTEPSGARRPRSLPTGAATPRSAQALALLAALAVVGAALDLPLLLRLGLAAGAVALAAFAWRMVTRAWRRALLAEVRDRSALEERLDTEIAQQQAAHGELFESRLVGRIQLDAAGQIVRANAAAACVLNVAPTDLPGRPIDPLLPGLWRTARLSQRTGEPGPARRTPVASVGSDAERPTVDAALRLLADGGAVVELVDVTTELRAAAEARRAQRATQALQRTQDERLERLSEVVHGPIESVLELVRGLAASCPAQGHGTQLAQLQASSSAALDLLDELLDLSRLESGAAALRDVDLDLLAIVDDAVADHAASHGPGSAWVVVPDPGLTRSLIGDATRLGQLASHLLHYASAAAPGEALLVEVATRPGSGQRVSASLSVRRAEPLAVGSTASGSPPPDAAVPASAGLVLAVARGLAERMGGVVTVSDPAAPALLVEARLSLVRAVLRVASDRSVDLHGAEVLVALAPPAEARAVAEQLRLLGARVGSVADAAELALAPGSWDAVLVEAAWLAGRTGPSGPGAGRVPLIIAVAESGAAAGAGLPTALPVAAWLGRPLRPSLVAPLLQDLLERRGGTATVPPSPAPEGGGEGPRLLLVEDDAVNQLIALRMLTDLGLDVTLVDNGLEGLEAAESGEYDLVLLDCELPGLDGLEVTRRLRAGGGPGAGVPVIALTGHVMPEEVARCRAAGMNAHLAKPFTREHLAAAVAPWLGLEVAEASAP